MDTHMDMFMLSYRKRYRAFIAVQLTFLFFIMGYTSQSAAQSGYSMEEVQKVLALIEHILEDQKLRTDEGLRAVEIAESEFNAYMAFLIDADNEEVLREVHVNLLKNNRIEGKIHIDLRGQRIPRFLKPEMNFYFAGRLHVDEGRARLAINEIFLENEPVQPALLELAILISSRIQGIEPVSLFSWYDLPYGIKDIKTKERIAIFYY
jgi:hypothetical protein